MIHGPVSPVDLLDAANLHTEAKNVILGDEGDVGAVDSRRVADQQASIDGTP